MWLKAVIILSLASLIQYYILSHELRPEFYMSVEDLCKVKGYTAKEQSTLTEDGYVLSLYRVFKGKPQGHPVLLLHGFSGACENFLVNVHTKASAFKLVDAGFDVWLLNSRGNVHSQNHVKLHPSQAEFWDWTAAEIGRYDLPAFISHVKHSTKAEKVALVGHSQGGTVILASLCLNPKFEASVSVAVSIAGTGGSFSNQSVLMKFFTSDGFVNTVEYFGFYSMLGVRSEYMAKLYTAFPNAAWASTRDRFDTSINGDDAASLGFYNCKLPGGTSTKNLRFIGSFARDDKKIQMPCYGAERNLKLYFNETAPVLDYSRVNTKVAVFGGLHDKVILKVDVDHLYEQLPKEKVVFYKSDYNTDHLGFLLSGNDEHIKDLIQVLHKSFE